jgi:hypothetical protein
VCVCGGAVRLIGPHVPAGMIMEREMMMHFVETVRGCPSVPLSLGSSCIGDGQRRPSGFEERRAVICNLFNDAVIKLITWNDWMISE